MSPFSPLALEQRAIYPDDDGEPIGENTTQFRWIVAIHGNLEARFAGEPLVFVAADLFWYPVEGRPDIRTAPDALVAFGRPKGERLSYLQWHEENIAPHVVWEIFSPGYRPAEMHRRFDFYERYGVEEYYLFDPNKKTVRGWIRQGERLAEIASLAGWVSPRLQIRFELSGAEGLELFHPDGRRFLTYLELAAQASAEQLRADQEADRADAEARRADSEAKRAILETKRAKQEAERAKQESERAKQESERAKQEAERAARLAAQLRALGVDPDKV